MVGGLSKLFGLTDPMVGFLGTFFSSISRLFYVSGSIKQTLIAASLTMRFVFLIYRQLQRQAQYYMLHERSTCS